MKTSSARRGFTLVEIMIVVVIIGLLAAMALPTFNRVRLESRRKAVGNNLRHIASTAAQYMLQRGVTQVSYTDTDFVGTGTDAYMRPISPVAGESYNTLVVGQSASQISVSADTFGTVTFNL